MGSGRSSSLPIGGDSLVVVGSGRTGSASHRSARVDLRDASGEPPFPLSKGKGRIEEIKYLRGSEYLKSTVQNALAVGCSKVRPLYGATFSRRYQPLFGVRVWSPDVLTSYLVPVPKMVCFFKVAFDNGLRFPLHPFIKGFCSISMSVPLNSRPITGVFWSGYWFSSGTRASMFQVYLCSLIFLA